MKIDPADAMKMFADSAAVYMYVVDYESDEILLVNNYYTEHLGVSADVMVGKTCWEFVTGDNGGRCPNCPRDLDLDGNGVFDPGPFTTEDYNPTLGIWGKLTGQGIKWIDGRQAHLISIIDISEEKMLREELATLAFYDKRMGIPNRAKLEKDIGDRPAGNYCLIAFDYSSLRHINEAYGRSFVNALLDAVVAWIRNFDLQNHEIYRIDSDEFCILLDNADMMSASGLADRLYERFQEPWEIDINGEVTTVTCHIAVCVVDGRLGFGDAESVLGVVDRTLDIAKETKIVSVYDKNLDETLKHDMALEFSLKTCVQEGMKGFEVYFQPIIDPHRERWIGLEALCRWTSPEFRRIPPLVFIHIADQIGVSNKIGYWVLDTAIEICARLELYRLEDFFLDVNLSSSQINDESLINKVLLSLQRHGFPAHCLSLEVTDSRDIEAAEYSHTIIERLRSLDVKVALDDFGTGYSNFNNLRSLPVRILKTEKQFIDNIVTDKYQQFLTKALIDLAHAAEMPLISEGVETEEQMKELIKNGVDYLQGYLFAKPLSVDELGNAVNKFKESDEMVARIKKELGIA